MNKDKRPIPMPTEAVHPLEPRVVPVPAWAWWVSMLLKLVTSCALIVVLVTLLVIIL